MRKGGPHEDRSKRIPRREKYEYEYDDDDWCDDMQDIIDDDNRQRAADMNATLRGGW